MEIKESFELTSEHLRPREPHRFHILRRVAIESIWGLVKDCDVLVLSDGELLLEKDQSNRMMYMVLSGHLTVHLDSADAASVAVLEEGQTVGELSVIDRRLASAYVKAVGETMLLGVDEVAFWRLVRASHEFCTNLLLLLAQRMRTNNFSLVESERLQRQFAREAMTDGLTGLLNRRWLNERLPRLLTRYQQDEKPLSVFMADVDHFKRYNDTQGHTAGDCALIAVASAIVGNVRPLDVTIRYGGEEFCVILPETDLSGAAAAAERLVRAVAEVAVYDNQSAPLPGVTISIGVACAGPRETMDSVLKRADEALYRAKEAGRDRAVIDGGVDRGDLSRCS